MPSWLGEILKNPEKREMLSWCGGGVLVIAGGLWLAVTFVAVHKGPQDKTGGAIITVGQGRAAGGGTPIGGGNFVPYERDGHETMTDPQKPPVEAGNETRENKELKDLVVRLIANSHSPAAPGAEQAVGAAVQSIAQGAAEGDLKSRQAFGLLKGNKTVDATRVLNALAEERRADDGKAATQEETYRKDVARAYRTLGAIVGLRDSQRALESYEKALALDPDDIDTLFWAGSHQIDLGDLNKAQSRLEHVLKLAESGNMAFYKYGALLGLGDIKQRRGDLRSALKSYEDSLAIAGPLAASDPGNAEWQHNLSVSYDDVGDVQMAQGDLEGARESYSDSLAIREGLAKADPSNLEWQRDLYVSFKKIGDEQEAQGDFESALKSYEGGLAIAERLAASDPGNELWQYDLGMSDERIGDAEMAERDLAAALKSYKAKRDIIARLAASDTGNAEWQRDLSVSYEKIGDVQKAQGDLGGALKSYSDSLAIRERLAKTDAWNPVWQDDLAKSFVKCGSVYRQTGDQGKARRLLQKGHELLMHLTKRAPDNAAWKKDLAECNGELQKLER